MTAPNNTTLPSPSDNNPVTSMGPVVSNEIKTLDEARQFMGSRVLEPAYLPKGFKLKGIQGVSNDDSKTRNIWLEYTSGDRTFVISIEQNSPWGSFEGYRSVGINDMEGYIKAYKDSSFEASELRWFSGKDLYTIEGAISEEDALKIAQSLK
jgi:hypothetical protein